MNKTIFLFIRNVNLIFVSLIIAGLFLVSKESNLYFGLEIIFGADLALQSTAVVWCPDLFLHFLSIFGTSSEGIPMWSELKSSKKIRLSVTALFFLLLGIVAIYSGISKLNA